MAITAKQVNDLRQITGAGMMDCKKALEEANGDQEAAIDILRKNGQKVAAKRADRNATEGVAFVYSSEDGTLGIGFTLNCETEPVSKTAEFNELGKAILNAAVERQITNTEDLLQTVVKGEKVIDHITLLSGKIGEKIEISKYTLVKAEKVVTYLHGNKIAVLLGLKGIGSADVTSAGKDVCMQIAAMNPLAIDENSVDAATIEREKEIGMERARQEGKPENILAKIAEGYVKKYFQENTLLPQAFVKDPKITVKQYLDSVNKGLTVTEFHRLSVGR
jgi:elongation factor Ts